MPILKTDIAEAQQDYRGLAKRPDGAKVTGKLGYLEAVYTTTGTEANGDIIDIGDIPEGAIVLPERCRIASEGCGGTGTAITALGDSVTTNRYSTTGYSLMSAGLKDVIPVLETSVIVRTPVTAATKTIKARFALSSGSVTAGKKIVFMIEYRHP